MSAQIKTKIVSIIRSDFDQTPKNWEGSNWYDNAEEVADDIIALFPSPAPAAATDDLVSRAEVLRVIRALGNQDADLALYGAADNARAREYGEAAATRACCAIALMPPASPSPAPAAVDVVDQDDMTIAYMLGFERGKEAAFVAAAEREAALQDKLRNLTMLLDQQLGTPCEQIRSAEREAALVRERDRLRKSLDNAMASRIEWRRQAEAAEARVTAAEAERDRMREALVTSLSTMLESRDRLLCYHARTSELDYAINAARAAIRKETTA